MSCAHALIKYLIAQKTIIHENNQNHEKVDFESLLEKVFNNVSKKMHFRPSPTVWIELPLEPELSLQGLTIYKKTQKNHAMDPMLAPCLTPNKQK